MSPKAQVGLVFVLAGITVLVASTWRPRPIPAEIFHRTEAGRSAAIERYQADLLYGSAKFSVAKASYESFVDKHKSSPNPEVQDEVGAARIRLGYIAAKADDFAEARKVLLEADRFYEGTGAKSPDYGRLDDQAAYQAIVCLENLGKKVEAKTEYLAYIKDRPYSPMVHACLRRIKRMNGGKSSQEAERLLQIAIDKQKERNLIELALCGPRAVAETVRIKTGLEPEIEEIKKLCKTTKEGSTVTNLIAALAHYKLTAEAFELNAADLHEVSTPAILLHGTHFVVIRSITEGTAEVYDPMYSSIQKIQLPKKDDPKFRAVVIRI